ncbi:MAG: hypothetical protein ACE37I_21080 [Rubinisphaera brasiliensis]|uniref:Transmembrane protein n=1 Tax=Rubinisphaera brasiliensis (strain ATCC 49424 / DSM 5305 / JCM 21570 / IAM 15109 / NBRC 103401 / IFAM 1448) TaxID=756272 RepID=F0SSE3_RUBBR|nr:hypothetical protein [Rubinisphaera brasiliensis]ADY59214.1 hypothetical protein Plabr_1603 [Rubinisphaera brasiliensis DSM 5305]
MSTTKHEEVRKQATLETPSLALLFWIGGVLLTLAALDASLRSPREWALNGILLVSSTAALWQGCLAIATRGARRYFSFGFLFIWCLLHYLNDPARELLTSIPHFEREVGNFFERFYPSQGGSRRFAPIATEYVILFGAVLGGFVTRRAFDADHGPAEKSTV